MGVGIESGSQILDALDSWHGGQSSQDSIDRAVVVVDLGRTPVLPVIEIAHVRHSFYQRRLEANAERLSYDFGRSVVTH